MIAERIHLNINGVSHSLEIEPRVTLLDALREYLHLTGTKKGCDHGVCGACTVLIDGQRRLSCLTLAIMQTGREIRTIEGVATNGDLHPLQAAFVRRDAFQCGYCTSGQIMAALGLLTEGFAKTRKDIAEQMENQCRCGCYVNIVDAIADVLLAVGDAKQIEE